MQFSLFAQEENSKSRIRLNFNISKIGSIFAIDNTVVMESDSNTFVLNIVDKKREHYGLKSEILLPVFKKDSNLKLLIGFSYFLNRNEDFCFCDTWVFTKISGGGVYAGIDYKKGTKTFGFSSSISLGYFFFNERIDNKIDYVESQSLSRIGSIMNLGVYFTEVSGFIAHR